MCGICRGEHRTSDCSEDGKRFCASCKSDSHTSWDRNCPELIKHCTWYNGRHPDNLLRFFPTEDSWMQEARPAHFLFMERFLVRFAVGSLPLPNHNGRELPARTIEKPAWHPKKKGKKAAGQTTIDRYFQSSQRQSVTGEGHRL
jgi:hypothetical protein